MANSKIQKLTQKFITQFGPVTKQSMARIAYDLENGNIQLNNVSQAEAKEVFGLAAAISYMYDPNRFETGGDIQDPKLGRSLLQHQELQSPVVQQKIAALAGSAEYSEAVNEKMHASQQGQNSVLQGTDQGTGLNMGEHTDMPDHLQGNEAPRVTPTATGGGYQYVGQSESFYQQRETRPTGNVTMRADGRGGTYVSKMHSGDSRAVQGASQGNSGNSNGPHATNGGNVTMNPSGNGGTYRSGG